MALVDSGFNFDEETIINYYKAQIVHKASLTRLTGAVPQPLIVLLHYFRFSFLEGAELQC